MMIDVQDCVAYCCQIQNKIYFQKTKQQVEEKPKVPARKTSNESTEKKEGVQKKANNSGYWQYKNREGPKNLGSKEIPEVRSIVIV